MRLIDANVFIYAFLKPRRELRDHEKALKERAKRIISRVNGGERVAITVAQLTEVANILESYLPSEEAREVEEFLVMAPNVEIIEVTRSDCRKAIELARDSGIGFSDAVACAVMKRLRISEIYSFDRDFDRVEDITRVTE